MAHTMDAMIHRMISTLLAACAIPLVAMAQPNSLPLKPGAGGTFTVPVSLNGAAPKQFVLDLGAGVALLSPTVDAQNAPIAHITGWRMTGERLDGVLYRIPSLSLGPLTVTDDLVAHWSGVAAANVEGMVSAREFASTPITLDFTTHQLIFEGAESLRQRARDGIEVPIALQDDRGKALLLFADVNFGHGQSGECLIDTGQFNIQINKRYMKALGVETGGTDVLLQDDRVITHLPDISLDGAPAIHAAGAKAIFRDIIYDCVIGNRFWANDKIVTFDIAHRRMYIRTVAAAANAP
jgi:hypothetical protein